MLIKKGLGNIHCAINHNLIPQAGAGVNPRNSRTPSGAVVEHGSFDAAKLSRMRYFVAPVLWCQANLLLVDDVANNMVVLHRRSQVF